MQVIPIQPLPSQLLSFVAANQQCVMTLYVKGDNLYFDLTVGGSVLCRGRMIRNAVPMLRAEYSGFVGDFFIVDLEGANDPLYTGLGSRYRLVYMEV